MTSRKKQSGMGLIEVMIALAILLLTSIAAGTLQTSGFVSAQASSMHFSLDQLGNDMIDMLRAQSVDALKGSFNFDGASVTSSEPDDTSSPEGLVYAWNKRVGLAIPTGQGAVDCAASQCEISISWIEEIDGADRRQFFRILAPL